MKEFVDELIMCPKCGAEGSVRWVRKFNAREDRALMNHFIDETHEKYICEKCKYEKKFPFKSYIWALQKKLMSITFQKMSWINCGLPVIDVLQK